MKMGCFGSGFGVGDCEEDQEGPVEAAGGTTSRGDAILKMEENQGDGVAYFFQHGWNHHGAVLDRVGGQNQEQDLPGNSKREEAVEKFRVGDGRRVVAAEF